MKIDLEVDSNNNPSFNGKNLTESIPVVRILLLTMIYNHPDITGYEIIQKIYELTNERVKLHTGTAYTELRKLENQNYVISEQSLSGRKKRKYRITSEGRQELIFDVNHLKSRIDNVIVPIFTLIDDSLQK